MSNPAEGLDPSLWRVEPDDGPEEYEPEPWEHEEIAIAAPNSLD